VFLSINDHRPHASQDDVVQLVVSVADGTLTDINKIAERLAAWSKPAGV
jgi:prophage maintenance system killer protein